MVFFPNETIEIWNLYESTEYDPYTDENLTKWKLTKTIQVDWQPVTPQESMLEFGQILQDTYKIYTQEKIPSTSIIRLVGGTDTYKIRGSPQTYNHFNPTTHEKLILIKEQTPHKLTGE